MRDSNMELLRLFAMFLVMLVHVLLLIPIHDGILVNVCPKSVSCLYILDGFSVVCVNVFVLLSGWFGISLKKESLLKLLFQVFFFSLLIFLFFCLKEGMFSWQVVSTIFMFNHNDYWFVKAYIGLYLLSPALNMFVKNLTQTQFKTILILLLSFQTIYGWIDLNGVDWIAGGYSAYSFMILYLLARYVRKYMADKISFSFIKLFFSYLLIGLFQAIVGYLLTSFGYSVSGRLFTYTNPIVIIQSLLLVLAFSKLNFKSRIVNILSTSCLAIYLFHGNELILRPIYGKMIADWFFQLSFPLFCCYTFFIIMFFYIFAIVIDRIRIFLWNRIYG